MDFLNLIKANTDKLIKVPFLKTPISYEQWKTLQDDASKQAQAKTLAFQNNPLQNQLNTEILRGQISKTLNLGPKQEIKLHEYMFDTALTYTIPLDYLRTRISEYMSDLNSLDDIGSLQNRTYSRKVELRKRVLDTLIKELTMHVNYVTSFLASSEAQYFKPALRKWEVEYRCMPTNLQLNRSCVFSDVNSNSSEVHTSESVDKAVEKPPSFDHKTYDTITFGVGSDHFQRKSKYGLLKYVIDQKPDCSIFEVDRFTPIMLQYFRLSDLLQSLKQKHNLFENRIITPSGDKESTTELLSTILTESNHELLHSATNLFKQDCLQFTIFGETLKELENEISKFKNSQENFSGCYEVASNVLRMGLSCLYLADVIKDEINYSSDHISSDPDFTGMIFSDTEEIDEKRVISEVNYMIRRDVVSCQVLAAASLGVASKIVTEFENPEFWEVAFAHGILLQFETLVSTWRAEQIMLEDHSVGVLTDLAKTKVRVKKGNKFGVKYVGSTGEPWIEISIPDIDESDKKEVKIVPVLFNVGVNEEQNLADIAGQMYPQDITNYTSAMRLANYFRAVNNHEWAGDSLGASLLKLLERCPDPDQSKPEKKDIKIHELASKIVRELNGVRFVQCKSAKDRTSMACSLEQTRILMAEHGLQLGDFKETLDSIRRDGVGLVRCYKNVGKYCYAFNSLQLATFPTAYKPPKGTYGAAMS